MNTTSITNGYALITGASSGIGMALAHLMAQRGHNLLLVARSADKLQTLSKALQAAHGVNVHALALDLAVPGAAQTLYDHCHQQGLAIDILVNNAGFGDYKTVVDAQVDVYRQMLQLNVVTLTELTCLFVKDFKRQGYGRIANIGSASGFQPCPGMASYGASKAYVMQFTEALHAELQGTGVSATVINPGMTATGFVARAEMGGSVLAQAGLSDANDVARAVYDAMMAGEMNRVVGWVNKLWAQSTLLAGSRHLLVWIAKWRLRPRTAPRLSSAG